MLSAVMLAVLCLSSPGSATALEVRGGTNRAEASAHSLRAVLRNERDAQAFFNALAKGDERPLDSGVERVLEFTSTEDAIKIRCVGNSEHACQLLYSTRERQLGGERGAPKLEIQLSNATSTFLFSKLDVSMRAAGHTAMKELATEDGLLALVCARYPGYETAHCWLDLKRVAQ